MYRVKLFDQEKEIYISKQDFLVLLDAVLNYVVKHYDQRGFYKVERDEIKQKIVNYITFAGVGVPGLIALLIYLDRYNLSKKNYLSPLQLIPVCLTVFDKFHNDCPQAHSIMASVGNLCNQELKFLEIKFLRRIQYSMHITRDQFHCYCDTMLSSMAKNNGALVSVGLKALLEEGKRSNGAVFVTSFPHGRDNDKVGHARLTVKNHVACRYPAGKIQLVELKKHVRQALKDVNSLSFWYKSKRRNQVMFGFRGSGPYFIPCSLIGFLFIFSCFLFEVFTATRFRSSGTIDAVCKLSVHLLLLSISTTLLGHETKAATLLKWRQAKFPSLAGRIKYVLPEESLNKLTIAKVAYLLRKKLSLIECHNLPFSHR